MPKCLYIAKCVFIIGAFLLGINKGNTQCNPPPAETCEEAVSFCSLDEMNGYSCNNQFATYNLLRPGCGGPGWSYRTWWSFVTEGGNVSITFNVGTCSSCVTCNFGIVWGIWGDCQCTQEVACVPGCIPTGQSITYNVNLKPCKVYYISADACCDCICDFTINTSGGKPPNVSLTNINNNTNGILGPICAGTSTYKLYVDLKQSNCIDPIYIWTLDGVEVGGNSKEINLGFPDPGEFLVCVSATIGNPSSGFICAQDKKCATIKVVTPSEPAEVFYITCNNKPYIDPTGKSHSPCKSKFVIPLSKKNEFECDSTILLDAVNVDIAPQWKADCVNGNIELAPNINILKPCEVGESYEFEYRWYRKNDTLQKTISTDERLTVDSVQYNYCVDVSVKVRLGTSTSICTKTFCDTIDKTKAGAIIENKISSYCDSAVIQGKTYFQNDTVTEKYQSATGCDSIIKTIIKIHKTSSTDLDATGCDSLRVNGQLYVQSGDYTQYLNNSDGCDSLLKIHVDIYKTKFSALFNSACDSVSINGQTYTQTGQYTQLLKTTDGCDSILRIDADVFKSSSEDQTYNACDSIDINGKVYKQSGNYTQKLFSVHGCDSILNLEIEIRTSGKEEIGKTGCDSVVYNGKVYKQSGDYIEQYTSSNGCDSIIVLHVNIPNSNTTPYVLTRCDSVTINNILYTQSGKYTQQLTSVNGCDSILNIDLEVQTSRDEQIGKAGCDSVEVNNVIYRQSGSYLQKLQTAVGCDSNLSILVDIAQSTNGDTIFRSCDSVTINGITYTQSGIYSQTLINSQQCDSTLVIDFTRLSKSSASLVYQSCDSLKVNNQVFKQSGKYTQILTNLNQCDSVISLDINIGKSNSKDSITAGCDSLTFNGQTYYQSGNYNQKLTNADLCDSTLNLYLTLYKSSHTDNVLQACDSVFRFGKWFYQSGNYPQYLKDVHQCDSTVNLQLTITPSTKSTITQTACDSIVINDKTYFLTGNYAQYLTSSNGCDSTITLDLTIKPGNPSTLDAGRDTSICEGEIIKLNGLFTGNAKFKWSRSPSGAGGNFDHADRLSTNYYSNTIGTERIYLFAEDDCKQWLDSLNLQILPNQFVRVTGDTIIDPCKEKEIRFTATGGTNYIWTPSSNIECLDPPCSQVLLKSNLASRFTITTDGPCAFPANLNLSLSQTQSEVYLPNAFSPNGDNINDMFLPIFNCEAVTFYNLQIFDRWGNLMFESTNKDLGWNGKQEDVQMIPGVYPYVVEYEVHGEKKVKGGEVTLIR